MLGMNIRSSASSYEAISELKPNERDPLLIQSVNILISTPLPPRFSLSSSSVKLTTPQRIQETLPRIRKRFMIGGCWRLSRRIWCLVSWNNDRHSYFCDAVHELDVRSIVLLLMGAVVTFGQQFWFPFLTPKSSLSRRLAWCF